MHTETKVLPFQANNGRDPKIRFELRKKKRYKRAEKFINKIEEVQRKAKTTLVKAQENIRRYVDKHRAEVVKYKVENLVLLNTKDLK